MGHDLLQNARFNVRPDRTAGRGGFTGQVIGAGDIGHIFDRNLDGQVQRPIGGRINDLNG